MDHMRIVMSHVKLAICLILISQFSVRHENRKVVSPKYYTRHADTGFSGFHISPLSGDIRISEFAYDRMLHSNPQNMCHMEGSNHTQGLFTLGV